MKTNVAVTLSDEQRNRLAIALAGKNVKRKVTRREVKSLVEGFFEAMLSDCENASPTASPSMPEAHRTNLDRVPAKYADKPESWKLGWLRGWDSVGRMHE